MFIPLVVLVIGVFAFQYFVMKADLGSQQPAKTLVLPPDVSSKLSEGIDELPLPQGGGAQSPKETVLNAISELKKTQDPRVVLKYVWWEGPYRNLNDYLRERLYVHSPRQLYNYYYETLTSSGSLSLRQLAYEAELKTEEKRKRVLEFVKSQRSPDRHPDPYTAISKTLFEITSEKIEDRKAEIALNRSDQGKITHLTIPLSKIGEVWLLDCVEFVPDPLNLCGAKS